LKYKERLASGASRATSARPLVLASQSFSDPKIMIMFVACTIVMLVMLIPASS
jgi:hypothetical protein